MSRRRKGRKITGRYVALVDKLTGHRNFATLSPRATKLFIDMAIQYNGHNNGDFSCVWRRMRTRGWTSCDQLAKAKAELLERGFIELTRQGGRNRCNLYALSIWPIDECKGKLDVPATTEPSNLWKLDF